MLTKRQNLLETIRGGNPDRFVNQYEAFGILMGSPFGLRNPAPKPGELNVVNAWGVTRSWPAGLPGAFPVHTPDKIVIKDIENWRDYVKVPNVVYNAEEWEPFIEAAEKIDRNEQFATAWFVPGNCLRTTPQPQPKAKYMPSPWRKSPVHGDCLLCAQVS